VEIGDGNLRAPDLAECQAGSAVAARRTLPAWASRLLLAAGFVVALWAMLAVVAAPARADEPLTPVAAGCVPAVVEDAAHEPPADTVPVPAGSEVLAGAAGCLVPEGPPAPSDPPDGPPADPGREEAPTPPESSTPDPAPQPLPQPLPVPLPLPDPAPQLPAEPQPAPQPEAAAPPEPVAEPVAAAQEPAAEEPTAEQTVTEPEAAEPTEPVSTMPVTAVVPATAGPVLPALCTATTLPMVLPPGADFTATGRSRDHADARSAPTGTDVDAEPTVAPASAPADQPAPLAPHGMPVPMPAPVPAGSSAAAASGGHGGGPGQDHLQLDGTYAVLAAEIADPLVGSSAATSGGFTGAVVGSADDPGASPG
jgi:hypothetical protein